MCFLRHNMITYLKILLQFIIEINCFATYYDVLTSIFVSMSISR